MAVSWFGTTIGKRNVVRAVYKVAGLKLARGNVDRRGPGMGRSRFDSNVDCQPLCLDEWHQAAGLKLRRKPK
jgi:hypothetical protein